MNTKELLNKIKDLESKGKIQEAKELRSKLTKMNG